MKWETQDIDVYVKEKEYVDTVILPLIPVEWGDTIKSTVAEGEFVNSLTKEVEMQLKGRILLCPPFTYLKSNEINIILKQLTIWRSELVESGVRFITYLTSDVRWKQVEEELETLIWVPAIPIGQMEGKYRRSMLDDHTSEILKTITNMWK